MLIGLVGKPNCGKSTFFKAATLAEILIANYPFATVKPNHGIAYVKIDCVDKDFNLQCKPHKGYCVSGKRFVPVELLDVAGLVEGASEGKGLGNQFLDDLTSADALIHIVDVSGETDSEGKEAQGYDPLNDVKMLEKELDLWYLGILKKVWKTFARTVQNTKADFAKSVAKQFSGLKVREDDIKKVVLKLKYDSEKPNEWGDEQLHAFAHELRHISKPMIIAANKIDKPASKANFENLKTAYPELMIIPCSAEAELALREASNHELIEYIPGEKDFDVKGELNEKQQAGLDKIKNDVLEVYQSTGIQEVLNKTVFELLEYVAGFPVANTKLTDLKGNVLPDCLLVKKGSTAQEFASAIHTDFGKNFIKAINMKTKQAVGKDYEVKHQDVLEIMTR
jgi:ribosome-binding ATPase YchF (GTP1/OBG family)